MAEILLEREKEKKLEEEKENKWGELKEMPEFVASCSCPSHLLSYNDNVCTNVEMSMMYLVALPFLVSYKYLLVIHLAKLHFISLTKLQAKLKLYR